MQTNLYEPPASTNVEIENSAKFDNSEVEHRSVVRILSAVGIVVVSVDEAWQVVFSGGMNLMWKRN